MRRLLHWLSPWHRGYEKGYSEGMRHAEVLARISAVIAAEFPVDSDEAKLRLARALEGR